MKYKLLFQIFVLLTVPFNTIRAVQIVQAKLNAQTRDSAIPAGGRLKPSITLAASNRIETIRVAGVLSRPASIGSYSVPLQPESENNPNNSVIPGISGASVSVAVTPPTMNSGEVAVNLDLPAFVFQGPGQVIVPILLYHRVDVSSTDSQYYVSPGKFEEQMKLLRDWGYTTITTELLVKTITEGADLPLRPIIITFDDGHLNNYTTAFPIMKKYGFTGILYIVGSYMDTPAYMTVDQIKEMAKDGWEVGSHSMGHLDLTSLDQQQLRYEIIESRNFLETKLGVPIQTFSYPFGVNDITVINLAYSAGYIAAMGTGYTYAQGEANLFALQRRGVDGTRDLNWFASFLPWQGDPVYLSADTPAEESVLK